MFLIGTFKMSILLMLVHTVHWGWEGGQFWLKSRKKKKKKKIWIHFLLFKNLHICIISELNQETLISFEGMKNQKERRLFFRMIFPEIEIIRIRCSPRSQSQIKTHNIDKHKSGHQILLGFKMCTVWPIWVMVVIIKQNIKIQLYGPHFQTKEIP